MEARFEFTFGIYTLSGKAWAEKPDRAHGMPGSFQFRYLHIAPTDSHNTEVPPVYLSAKELAVLEVFGMDVDMLEQTAYEKWQESGYE